MNIEVLSLGPTDQQRRCAAAAAAQIFAAKGMAADVAATALLQDSLDDSEVTPAQARAAAIWKKAALIASQTCVDPSSGNTLSVDLAMLLATP